MDLRGAPRTRTECDAALAQAQSVVTQAREAGDLVLELEVDELVDALFDLRALLPPQRSTP